MPEEPSESSAAESSDAAILGLDDSDLDPEPEISEDVTPVESPSEEEEEAEAESKEAESKEPAEEKSEEGESAAPAETEEPAASEPEPFKFLDKEYVDINAAEHDLRSYLGQLKAKDEQIKELTGVLKNLNDQLEASGSRKDETPAQSEDEPKEKQSKPSSLWDAIDFNTLEEEVENRGLRSGLEYLVYKMDEQVNSLKEGIRQEMMGEIAPFQAWQEQMAEFNESFSYFNDLSQRIDENENLLYPELSGKNSEDQAFSERVAKRWLNTFTPQERKRLGVYGAHMAYVLQKTDEGWPGSQPAPEPPPPEPESKVSEAFDRLNRQTNQGANEGVLTGSSSVKPPSRRTSNDIVNRELEEYGDQVVEPLLGI